MLRLVIILSLLVSCSFADRVKRQIRFPDEDTDPPRVEESLDVPTDCVNFRNIPGHCVLVAECPSLQRETDFSI
ncbi:hypothetical protein HDE_13479 [Halotydeus destructor]|nr:hypothetical protein HDE_13479 [Halotydeus destructor]